MNQLKLIVAVCLAGLIGLGDSAFAQDKAIANRMLKRFDTDKSGKIEKSEAAGQLQRNFDRVDSNSDGAIDESELLELAKRLAARQGQNRNGNRRLATVPKNVELKQNVAYREGHEKWKVDLMLPTEKSETPRPGIVFIHGGGWRSGDKGSGLWRSMPLEYASKGYVCISVNYRLIGDAPFPACIEDCKCAVRWFRANAKKFNLDPRRIGAYGNSAGAHLVSILGLAGPDAKLEGDGPYQDQSSMVQAVCCSAPPTDFMNWGEPGRSLDRVFSGAPKDQVQELLKSCSPVTHASAKAPPFLIVHGTADRTVPFSQGTSLRKSLQDAGAKDVKFMKFEGAGHGVFGQKSKETHPAMEAFFKRTLKNAQG